MGQQGRRDRRASTPFGPHSVTVGRREIEGFCHHSGDTGSRDSRQQTVSSGQKIEVRGQRSEDRGQEAADAGRRGHGETETRRDGDAEKRQSVIGYMVMALGAMLSNN